MKDFLDRMKKNNCTYVDLNESESELYRGAGWAIAHVSEGEINSLTYLNEFEYESEEEEAQAAVKAALKEGNAYFGMCSSYQFCEPELIRSDNPTLAARIMRLSVEDDDQ
tara:strand:- start:41 stop:370 length:330 start_codon:yes stop_codon:yes gene_type:complete